MADKRRGRPNDGNGGDGGGGGGGGDDELESFSAASIPGLGAVPAGSGKLLSSGQGPGAGAVGAAAGPWRSHALSGQGGWRSAAGGWRPAGRKAAVRGGAPGKRLAEARGQRPPRLRSPGTRLCLTSSHPAIGRPRRARGHSAMLASHVCTRHASASRVTRWRVRRARPAVLLLPGCRRGLSPRALAQSEGMCAWPRGGKHISSAAMQCNAMQCRRCPSVAAMH